jgi:hypothetical protein
MMQHERLFEEYILGMMCEGVERQIRDAYGDGDASARLMASVALMAYTEFLGAVEAKSFEPYQSQAKFEGFLKYMGGPYREMVEKKAPDAYDVFRNGLVHNFFVKGICTIAMKNNPGPILVIGEHPGDVVIQKPVDAGLGRAANGGYYLVVEKYYLDFKTACLRLYAERKGKGMTYPLPVAPKPPKDVPPGGNAPDAWVRAAASPMGTSTPLGDSG